MICEIPNLRRPVEDDPCFPLYGELIRMLEEDMDLELAILEHCMNFGFDEVQSDHEHDLSHILLGFAFLKIGYDPIGLRFSYNNNYLSEHIVRAIETPIHTYINDHTHNLDLLHEKCLYLLKPKEMAKATFPRFDMAKEDGKRIAVLMDLAQQQNKLTSYFDLLVANENTAKNYTNSEFIHMGDGFEVTVNKPSIEELETIYGLLIAPIRHVIEKLYEHEKQHGTAFIRKHGVSSKWQEEANGVFKTIKMRDLWNLMPITEYEPVFPFSNKGQMQLPACEML